MRHNRHSCILYTHTNNTHHPTYRHFFLNDSTNFFSSLIGCFLTKYYLSIIDTISTSNFYLMYTSLSLGLFFFNYQITRNVPEQLLIFHTNDAKLCLCKSLVAMKTSQFNPNGCIAKGCCIVKHSSQVIKIKVHTTVRGE